MSVQLSVHSQDETVNHYGYGMTGQNNDDDDVYRETYRQLPQQPQSNNNKTGHPNAVNYDRDNRNAVYVESGNGNQYGGIYGKGNTEGQYGYGSGESSSDECNDDDVVLRKAPSKPKINPACFQPQPSLPNVYQPMDNGHGNSPNMGANAFKFPETSVPNNYYSPAQSGTLTPHFTPGSTMSNPLPNKPAQWTIVDPIKEREEQNRKHQNQSNRPRNLPKQNSVDNCNTSPKEQEFQRAANNKQRRVSDVPMPLGKPITYFPLPDLSGKPYFDNDVTKEISEQLLRSNKKEGEFIFRHSSQRDAMNFSLSFFSAKVEGHVRHVNICFIHQTNQWRLGKEERPDELRFDKVVTLCDYYIQHGICFPGSVKVELKKALKVPKKSTGEKRGSGLFSRRSSGPK